MTEMIRFHLDEHIPTAVALGLRRRGIDVTTTADVALTGAADEDHLALAVSRGRVVVTHDDDFLVLHSRGVQHSGIAYCHQGRRSVREMIRALLLLYECATPEEMKNRLEFL
jgi:predicted nuclease of predicted toxin-antitoxin system